MTSLYLLSALCGVPVGAIGQFYLARLVENRRDRAINLIAAEKIYRSARHWS